MAAVLLGGFMVGLAYCIVVVYAVREQQVLVYVQAV